jgi:hypothetical protein
MAAMLAFVNAAQEVLRAARARASALAEGDRARLAALLHSDFRWTSHLGETFSRHEYIERNTQGQTAWRSQELDVANVVVAGETAVLFAEVTDVILRDEEEVTFQMPVTQVWVRQGDDWTCLAGHAGPRLSRAAN